MLRKANLGDAVSFADCWLVGGEVTDADRHDADLTNATLRETDLTDADIRRADFTAAGLRNASPNGNRRPAQRSRIIGPI